MHELSLAQGIIDTIERVVTRNFSLVQSLEIEVGVFSGVVVDSLLFGLEFLLKEKGADRPRIDIHEVPAQAECVCGRQYELANILSGCPACGSFDRRIICGQDTVLKSVEIPDDAVVQ